MTSQPLKYLFVSSIFIVVLLVTVTLLLLFNRSLSENHGTYIAEIEATVISSKKDYLRLAVESTIQQIDSSRTLCLQAVAEGVPGGDAAQECDSHLFLDSLKERIRSIHLKDNGYIWVNQILDMNGGENYAVRLVHPNLPKTEGMPLSTTMTDVKGNTPYLTELEGVKREGEVYFQYWFEKMGTGEMEHKLAFAKLYKPYNWVVATGVYLDDVALLVEEKVSRAEQQMHTEMNRAIVMSVCAALSVLLLSLLFVRRFSAILRQHELAVDTKEAEQDELIDQLEKTIAERITQVEEVKQHYRLLYENAPVGLLLEDFSWFNSVVRELRRAGVVDFDKHFNAHPEILNGSVQNLRVLDVNSAALELYRAENKEQLEAQLPQTFTDEAYSIFVEGLLVLIDGETFFSRDTLIKTFAGELINVQLTLFIQPADRNWSNIYVAMVNIEDRKLYEDELRKSSQTLEARVQERTSELERTVKLMSGREVRMKELKQEVATLKQQLGRRQRGASKVEND